MGKEEKQGKVYQFDPGRKKRLKSVKYVSPEKKQLFQDRRQSKTDKKNFYIGVAVFILIVAALSYFRLRF